MPQQPVHRLVHFTPGMIKETGKKSQKELDKMYNITQKEMNAFEKNDLLFCN